MLMVQENAFWFYRKNIPGISIIRGTTLKVSTKKKKKGTYLQLVTSY